MYTMVLMAAMTAGPEAPAFGCGCGIFGLFNRCGGCGWYPGKLLSRARAKHAPWIPAGEGMPAGYAMPGMMAGPGMSFENPIPGYPMPGGCGGCGGFPGQGVPPGYVGGGHPGMAAGPGSPMMMAGPGAPTMMAGPGAPTMMAGPGQAPPSGPAPGYAPPGYSAGYGGVQPPASYSIDSPINYGAFGPATNPTVYPNQQPVYQPAPQPQAPGVQYPPAGTQPAPNAPMAIPPTTTGGGSARSKSWNGSVTPAHAVVDQDSEPSPARLILEVPEGAKVTVDGIPLPGTSVRRKFHTPQLPRGRTFYYEFRVEVEVNGRKEVEEKLVSVCAGDELVQTFPKLIATR
ncbi:MAG: TIGR03000 domain-containing protein [Fimbriiglobus sp.]